jgi:hypothetical protein
MMNHWHDFVVMIHYEKEILGKLHIHIESTHFRYTWMDFKLIKFHNNNNEKKKLEVIKKSSQLTLQYRQSMP